VAGQHAKVLFAVGLFGASMLACGVLPLATAYAASEAFGFERGVSRSFAEAPVFIGLFTLLVAVGAGVALIPGLHPVRIMIVSQVVQGLLLPIILIFILKLVNNPDVMGDYTNGRLFNLAAWATTLIVSVLSVIFLGVTLLQSVGVLK
jgi:Mn2+/Fe2+ NRAMP family transporter